MADLDIDPFFTFQKAWDDNDLPDSVHFKRTLANGKRMKDLVTLDNGDRTIKFFSDVTYAGFKDMLEALQWPSHEMWTASRIRLRGDMRTVCNKAVSDDYSNQA